jgi:DNA modification methylase
MKIRNRIKELRMIKASELMPNPKNWRTHPKQQQDAIKGILAEVGYADALLARELPDGSLMLVDGHLRAESTPDLEVPVLVLDITESEADKLLLSLDPLSAMAGTDSLALDSLLREVNTGSEALSQMFADMAAEAGLYQDDAKEIVEDEVPEPPVDPITKPGDLWILGEHRLLCGDSTKADDVERLMDGVKADIMFTDPPYGVNYEGGHFHSGDVNIKRKREKLSADSTTQIYNDFLPIALAVVDGPCYMWFAGSKARDVYNAVHENECEIHALIIWHKTNAKYAAMNAQYKQRHEPCLYFKPRGSTLKWCGATTEASVWNQDRDGINEFHPTQKPVALAAKALKNHEAATVLDMFCGSGSTLIASEQLGRKCYGMEISPTYCDVIVQRWETLTGKKAVLEEAHGS